MNKCTVCNNPLHPDDTIIGTGSGSGQSFAHERCYRSLMARDDRHDRYLPSWQVRALRAEKLLHDLTPGGSEYYADPFRCAAWADEHMSKQHQLLVDAVVAKRKLEERDRAWADIVGQAVDALADSVAVCGAALDDRDDALASNSMLHEALELALEILSGQVQNCSEYVAYLEFARELGKEEVAA